MRTRTPPVSTAPLGGVAALRHALPTEDVAALGWLATVEREQLVLPIDLFMLTVHGNADGALDLELSLLRTRPARFLSRGGGLLAYALLTPSGLLKLLRAPLQGCGERRVELASVCGPADAQALRDAWFAAPDAPQRARQLGRWLEDRLHRRAPMPAVRVAQAAAWLQRQGGALELPALSRMLAVSPRQLERDFNRWLGLPPAAYARLVRFQRAAFAVARGEPLAQAACAHHYCDQSHLNRSVRAFSSLAPRQLVALARQPARRLEQRALAGRVFLLDLPPAAAADHSPLG